MKLCQALVRAEMRWIYSKNLLEMHKRFLFAMLSAIDACKLPMRFGTVGVDRKRTSKLDDRSLTVSFLK
jgi:hypothetical protein